MLLEGRANAFTVEMERKFKELLKNFINANEIKEAE